MKQMIFRNFLRNVWHTRGRFLAIFAIIAIGSGFFAGVKATSPDMKQTADRYYADTNLMDLHIKSTVGFSDSELSRLRDLQSVRGLYGCYSTDRFLKSEETTDTIVKLYSADFERMQSGTADAINRPVLVEGRYPSAPDECLIEVETPSEFAVGDTITVAEATPELSVTDGLAQNTFTVVGKVNWSMYLNFERGTTNIGNGTINSFLLVPDDAFDMSCYTDVFLTLRDTEGLYCYGDAYKAAVDNATAMLESEQPRLCAGRVEELKEQAQDAYAEAQAQLNEARTAYTKGQERLAAALSEIQKSIDDAQNTVVMQQAAYDASKVTYENTVAEIGDSKASLEKEEADLQAKEQEAAKTEASIEPRKKTWQSVSSLVNTYRYTSVSEPFTEFATSAIESAKALDTSSFSFSGKFKEYIKTSAWSSRKSMLYALLNENLTNYSNTTYNLQSQITKTKASLKTQRDALNQKKSALDEQTAIVESSLATLSTAESAITLAQERLEISKTELEAKKLAGEAELSQSLADIKDGEEELKTQRDAIDQMENEIHWYLFDRTDNNGYASFEEDADRVDSIAKVFPVFFLLIAALVSLTTMTRMVEEQRTEIGTLKALGYSRRTITAQYLLYSAAASVLGVFAGMAVCLQLFPRVIYKAYTLLYNCPDVICSFRWDYALGCLAAALLCTGLASFGACCREMVSVPAQLMRPKPPKNGKRVLLERISAIWKHLGFHAKVTVRNLMRYKSRLLMSVIGVAGCTALMLAGFGLKNGISVIVDLQFEEIMTYDLMAVYDNTAPEEELTALREDTAKNKQVLSTLQLYQKSETARANDKSREVTLFVPEDPARLTDYITLRDRKNQTPFSICEEGVVITEKLAKILNLSVGDSLTLDGANAPVTISAITENYTFHYVYLTPTQYQTLYGDYVNNTMLADLVTGANENLLSEELLAAHGSLQSMRYTAGSGATFRELIQTLNYIVLLIILSSGALAFVVLYNLANISITERMRELATIKVLGFYDGEVAAYIYRENTVSAICGMAAGLFGGIFLSRFIIRTSEIDMVMFYPDLPAYAFVLAGLLTLAFAVLVNGLLYWKLRKIDMAASMKAIE